MRKIYSLIRSLHLYTGLLISPVILIFALSVLSINNQRLPGKVSPYGRKVINTMIDNIPEDSTDLLTAKAIIMKLGIKGEIDFISKRAGLISFPVNKPGLKTFVEVNTNTKEVKITETNEGVLGGLNYLHIMPGQHNAKIRGNSLFMKFWRNLSDGTVYFLFFLTTSGALLYLLKNRRKTGIIALIAGMITFTALILLIYFA